MERPPINISEFIAQTGADDVVAHIQQQLKREDGTLPPVSDMIKTETDKRGATHTHQYVNYVQEGGGVLGVALLGYTYVLEKLGIRFYKLAGTSAGAINTMLTAVVDPVLYKGIAVKNSDEPLLKSEAVLYELINKNLFDLVDAAPFARTVIRKMLQKKNFGSRVIDRLILFLTIFLGATFVTAILVIARLVVLPQAFWWWTAAIGGVVSLLCIMLIVFTYLQSKKYLALFLKSQYGICTGENFHNWVTDILHFNRVHTTAELEALMELNHQGVEKRPLGSEENVSQDSQPVTGSNMILIASDITNQHKVEFPAMAKFYWEDPAMANPADFVRASMAIPIFFKPFIRIVTHAPQSVTDKMILQNIPGDTSAGCPCEVRFVDGGILSNFPINVFHNPNVTIARLPTFGVKLEDEMHEKAPGKTSLKQSVFSYVGNIFSTIRFYYDRDFLLRNQLYEKTIGHVDVHEFNWLNFFLKDADKVKLFTQGALAAKTFFLGGEVWVDGKQRQFEPFNWEKYKMERMAVVQTEKGGGSVAEGNVVTP